VARARSTLDRAGALITPQPQPQPTQAQ